jgi:DNA-binding NarL/FixJ family response regulator
VVISAGSYNLMFSRPIRLLVADDHAVVRQGVIAILKGSGIQVVGEAETGNQAIEQAKKLQPDVVLLDVRMPDTDGLQAIPGIHDRAPRTAVIVFTAHENPSYVARAVVLGARGYLMKGSTNDEIVEAIACAAARCPLETGGLTGPRISSIIRRWASDDQQRPLTNREVQVLQHVAFGLSNREIGRTLDITAQAVKGHVHNVIRKLQVGDRTEAAVWAVKHGLV